MKGMTLGTTIPTVSILIYNTLFMDGLNVTELNTKMTMNYSKSSSFNNELYQTNLQISS